MTAAPIAINGPALDERRQQALTLLRVREQLNVCPVCDLIFEDCGGHVEIPDEWAELAPIDEEPLYVNVKEWRDGGGKTTAPTLLRRTDDAHLFYRGKVNKLVGDPESAKTWIALAACAIDLKFGGRVLYIDADHNGIDGIAPRLDILGAPPDVTDDPARFRYAEVEDSAQYKRIIEDAKTWKPTITIVDSHNPVASMFGYNDNDMGDMRTMARVCLNPFAKNNGCVILIDHMAKNEVSRGHGESGSLGKGAALSGVSYRVDVDDSWAPATGGSSKMFILKDRPGGVRNSAAQVKGREKPYVGMFRLDPPKNGRVVQGWQVYPPGQGGSDLVSQIARLDTEHQKSANAAFKKLGGRKTDVLEAYRTWKAEQQPEPETELETDPIF